LVARLTVLANLTRFRIRVTTVLDFVIPVFVVVLVMVFMMFMFMVVVLVFLPKVRVEEVTSHFLMKTTPHMLVARPDFCCETVISLT